MGVGHEALAALRRPLDRAADLAGGPDADGVLGVGIDLRAEAAAHVRSDHAELRFRYPEHVGAEVQAQPRCGFWLVRKSVYSSSAGSYSATAARGSMALGTRRLLTNSMVVHVVGRGECLVDGGLVTHLPVVAQIAGGFVVQLRGRQCARGVDVRRQDLVVDLHGLGRVLRLRGGFRDDHRDVIADVAHLVAGQREVRRGPVRLAMLVGDDPAARQGTDIVRGQILAREDGDDARHGACRIRADLPELRVRMRRAHEAGVGLAGPIDVVRVAASSR